MPCILHIACGMLYAAAECDWQVLALVAMEPPVRVEGDKHAELIRDEKAMRRMRHATWHMAAGALRSCCATHNIHEADDVRRARRVQRAAVGLSHGR